MLQVDLSYMMRESKKKTAAPTSALPTTPATASKKGQNWTIELNMIKKYLPRTKCTYF